MNDFVYICNHYSLKHRITTSEEVFVNDVILFTTFMHTSWLEMKLIGNFYYVFTRKLLNE